MFRLKCFNLEFFTLSQIENDEDPVFQFCFRCGWVHLGTTGLMTFLPGEKADCTMESKLVGLHDFRTIEQKHQSPM